MAYSSQNWSVSVLTCIYSALCQRFRSTVPLICSADSAPILHTRHASLLSQLSTQFRAHKLAHTHTHWLASFGHVSSVEICNFCRHTHLSKVLRLRPLGCQSKCASLDTWPRPLHSSTVEQLTSFLIKFRTLAHTQADTHNIRSLARFAQS